MRMFVRSIVNTTAAVTILVVAAFCTGCSPEAFVRISPPAGGRVGFVSTLTPEFTNLHPGLTVFGKYNNRMPNDWDLDGYSARTASDLLRKAGYQVIDVRLDAKMVDGIKAQEDQTKLNYGGLQRDWVQLYQDVLERDRLDALVVLRESTLIANPNTYGTDYRGYGMVSPMGRKPDTASLFVTVTADAIGGRPPHRSVATCIANKQFNTSIIPVDNLSEVSMADLAALRPLVEALLGKKINYDLTSAGLLKGEAWCPGLSPQ